MDALIVASLAATAGITIASYAAVRCFAIKYSDSKHNQSLQVRLDKIEAIIKRVEAGKIEELESAVKMLTNVSNLSARAKR